MNIYLQDEDETKKKKANTKQTDCKYCNVSINLKQTKKLPKKLIYERHGLCWTGLEKVYLNIFKIVCPSCNKKYTHKVFTSEYIYK